MTYLNIAPGRAWLGLVFIFGIAVSANVFAELPGGLSMDHGFTYFQVESVSEPIDGKRVDKGWRLQPHIRIFGDAPPRSSIKVSVKKGRKVLAERRTETTVRSAGDPRLNLAIGNTAAGSIEPHIYIEGGVQGILPAIMETGELSVVVSYVDGSTDKEYEAHTYKINVGKVDHLDVAGGELLVRPPKYFVSRHQELLSTILSPWGYWQGGHGGTAGTFILLWNASPAEQSMKPGQNEYLRCSVDGKPLQLGNQNHPQIAQLKGVDATATGTSFKNRFIHYNHSDRNALEYRSGTSYREPLIFYNYHTRLPFQDTTDGFPPDNYGADYHMKETVMSDYPGEWECQWLDNGQLIRTFFWEVDENGPVPHAEQEEGLTLNPGAILVETAIPEGGAPFDGRVVPDAVEEGGFYGWEWESRAMRKRVNALEKIGNAMPVASAPEFVPEPDKGPSARELAKAEREANAAAARAEREADQAARDARLKAEREQYASDEAARLAENERVRSEAMEKEMARTQQAVENVLGEAQSSLEATRREIERQTRQYSAMQRLGRLALSLVLILSGLLLAGGSIAALEPVHKALSGASSAIGLAAMVIALVDFVLDLSIFRPIIGDGLPQLAALACAALLAKPAFDKLTAGKLAGVTAKLDANRQNVGIAALVLGLVHLFMGTSTLL